MSDRIVWTPAKQHMKSSAYATKPTRITRWLRVFIPWQVIRFIVLNWKIIQITRRNEHLS